MDFFLPWSSFVQVKPVPLWAFEGEVVSLLSLGEKDDYQETLAGWPRCQQPTPKTDCLPGGL